MVSQIILCHHCGSDRLRRDGMALNGKQKYFCNACHKGSRQNPTPRGVCRIFGICRQTLVTWLKKSRETVQAQEDASQG